MKTHLRVIGQDFITSGQTDYEYAHTAKCGYVRNYVTFDCEKVTCRHCINLMSSEGKKNELLSYDNAARMAESRSGHANVTVW